MGMSFLGNRSYCRDDVHEKERIVYVEVPEVRPSGNPQPDNFQFVRLQQVEQHVVAEVQYPDCNNYEGRKILVLPRTTVHTVSHLTSLDPHFCDGGHVSPFARFAPTEDGWEMAIVLAELLDLDDA